MRRFLFGAVMASIACLQPTWAFASDQETAQKIADSIRSSGKLRDYSIGVKFEDGRAFLMGRVANEQQAQTAVDLAKQLPFVEVVENQLEIKATPKQDFSVEQTAAGGVKSSSRRTMTRDDAVFGSVPQPSVPKLAEGRQVSLDSEPLPTKAPALKPAPTNARVANNSGAGMMHSGGRPIPTTVAPGGMAQRAAYDQPQMPCYSWPSYASHPNYAAVTYPNQYSAASWPYIGPFYPYPQVPLGWRKVTLEWKDGWWFLDFNDHCRTFRR